jgi:hypothetical protein
MTTTSENRVQLAERQVRHLNFWWKFCWNLHIWFVPLSLIASIVVSFGLAALLYIPKEFAVRLNLALLTISCLAMVLQVVDHAIRLPERARRLRAIHHRLELGLARFKDNCISADELDVLLNKAIEDHLNEEHG